MLRYQCWYEWSHGGNGRCCIKDSTIPCGCPKIFKPKEWCAYDGDGQCKLEGAIYRKLVCILCCSCVHFSYIHKKTQCYPNTRTQEHILEVKKGCLPGYLPNCQAILPRTTWYQQDSWHFGPVMTRIYFPGWKWKKSASVTIPQLPKSWAVLFSQFPHT